MKVPPELKKWMWLVWAGGFVMMFLAFTVAMDLNQSRYHVRAEKVARAFYAAEASGKEPSETFSEDNRYWYHFEILDKYGRAQRILKIHCSSAMLGDPSSCHVHVQRSRSKSYETIVMYGEAGVMVSKETRSPFR